MIKFPRYTRKENRACKLNDKQICEIRMRRANGEPYTKIAKDYDVSSRAIWYWCLSDADRKNEIRRRLKYVNKKFDHRAYRERKKRLHPELHKYENQFDNKYKLANQPNFKKSKRKADKKRWEEYKDKLKAQNKVYQLAHLSKFREYNRRYREKIKQQKYENSLKFVKKLLIESV